MLTERLLEGMSIDGTPFFEADSHGLKFNERDGSQPPLFANRIVRPESLVRYVRCGGIFRKVVAADARTPFFRMAVAGANGPEPRPV